MSRSLKPVLLSGLAALALLGAGPLIAQTAKTPPVEKTAPAARAQAPAATPAAPAKPAPLGLGRLALPAEIKAWDIDVRPDGVGLPPGKGTVRQGDELFQAQCASCHGEFGQGNGRWPVLAGG